MSADCKSAGTEVEATATPQNLVTDYCGEFMYEDGDLVCIFAPFGRIRPMATEQGTRWRTYYSLTDHLGNVRAEFVAHDSGQPELVQQTDYYPFGYTLRRNDFGSQHPNRRLFGSKELQDEILAGNTLDWYDFEARMYDPLIGRFMTTDPMAEKYYNLTPYEYCVNNPLRFIDPSGKTIVIGGDENASNEAFKQLQSSTSLILSKNKEGEVIIEGGKAKFFRDKLLMKAINDKSVIVNVDAIDGNSDDRTIGGSFMGNEIIETPISLFASKPFSELLSSSFRTVNTYQRVDPFETAILDDIGFLNEMGGEKAYRGQTMMHEVTESYIGGLNALKTGKPTGNASVSRQEFEEAHKAATLQPVLPDIKQILEEFRTRRGK